MWLDASDAGYKANSATSSWGGLPAVLATIESDQSSGNDGQHVPQGDFFPAEISAHCHVAAPRRSRC